MKPKCPNAECSDPKLSPDFTPVIRKGFYFRSSDSQWIRIYQCKRCSRKFSSATFSPRFGQKKRRLNTPIVRFLSSGVSQRRTAFLLGISPKTVARKLHFEANQARLRHESALVRLSSTPVSQVQFDDLETSEHTKCKPLSVALAVEPETRKILCFQVSQMPAKGHLAEISRRKYGPRKDERKKGWKRLFKKLTPIVTQTAVWTSDENPHYPRLLQQAHREAKHCTVKGRRGCITGQGELKKVGFDPLFSLNHTCAMLRANMNRLFRKTWCTTKTRRGLISHLWLYVDFHNRFLTQPGLAW